MSLSPMPQPAPSAFSALPTSSIQSASSAFAARFALLALLGVFAAGCAGSDAQQTAGSAASLSADASPVERVDAWIEQNEYEQALEWLASDEASSLADAQRNQLLEKTWLNYGLHNMSTFEPGEMRTRMNDALRCFARVIEINPANRMADQQIRQILGVYATMPGRGPEADVLETLRSLGYTP